MKKKLQIGLIGSYSDLPIDKYKKIAREIGKEIAKSNCIFVGGVEKNGGLVLESAKSCRRNGGIVVSICRNKDDATSSDIIIPTFGVPGLREYFLPLACDSIIAINGGSGTLNEISVAYQNNIPIIILGDTGGWSQKLQGTYLDDRKKYKFETAKTPKEAVRVSIIEAKKRVLN